MEWFVSEDKHEKIFFTIINELEEHEYLVTVDWKANINEGLGHINSLLEKNKIEMIEYYFNEDQFLSEVFSKK